jgi:hypothetical protein
MATTFPNYVKDIFERPYIFKRSSEFQTGKSREVHAEAHHKQTTENQRQRNLETAREIYTLHIRGQ